MAANYLAVQSNLIDTCTSACRLVYFQLYATESLVDFIKALLCPVIDSLTFSTDMRLHKESDQLSGTKIQTKEKLFSRER